MNVVLSSISGSLIGLVIAYIVHPPYPFFKFTIVHVGIGELNSYSRLSLFFILDALAEFRHCLSYTQKYAIKSHFYNVKGFNLRLYGLARWDYIIYYRYKQREFSVC